MRQLTIDPEFRDKIPPLSGDEYSRLEANILEDGEVREPIVVWGSTIIDGHNRWKIIQAHPEELQGKFKVKQMNFADKWAAIVWMCQNQLGRRNLSDEQKTYLIGKQCEAQSQTVPNPIGTNQYSEVRCQNDAQPKGPGKTAEIVSIMTGVPKRTVQRSVQFAKGLDAAERSFPGIRDSVLSGEVKAPKNLISEIRNIPEEHRSDAVEAIKRGDTDTAKAIIKSVSPKKEIEESSVDDRPAYNADDFKDALLAAVNTFDFSLQQHMVLVHMDILKTKEGKEAAEFALMQAKEVIKKYFRLVDDVVIKEESDNG